jgi:hypothetical protein
MGVLNNYTLGLQGVNVFESIKILHNVTIQNIITLNNVTKTQNHRTKR